MDAGTHAEGRPARAARAGGGARVGRGQRQGRARGLRFAGRCAGRHRPARAAHRAAAGRAAAARHAPADGAATHAQLCRAHLTDRAAFAWRCWAWRLQYRCTPPCPGPCQGSRHW
ncbi:hypothetical protein FFI97_000475 [Variovorax sp. KBS0712]|nr:hypothetical protein FFI97_000475 [Variovorax sp. KBS0712]